MPTPLLYLLLVACSAIAVGAIIGRLRARREIRELGEQIARYERETATRGDGGSAVIRQDADVVAQPPRSEHPDEGATGDTDDEGRRREEMLRRSERLASLGRMLAGTAHELNNPLAAVCGFAQLLLRGNVTDEQRAALETIDREAARAAAVVRDLLTFSRRRDHDIRQVVDLDSIARYVVGTRRYAVTASGISLEMESCSGPLEVIGESTQLEQVVFNLVANAEQALETAVDDRARASLLPSTGGERYAGESHASDANGVKAAARPRVIVRTGRSGGNAMVQVIDNGPGIAADRLSLIWDPFWTTRGDSEGTGLGLSVVHQIVQSHGGSVEVESTPGSGAVFRVTVPLLTNQAGDDAAGGAGERRAARPLDILVVGDDDDSHFLTRLLAGRGHAVVATTSPDHALRLASGGAFDVVMVDAMSVASDDGWLETLHRNAGSRAASGQRTTRILLMVDEGDATPAHHSREDGVAACTSVARPFDMDLLRHTIEQG